MIIVCMGEGRGEAYTGFWCGNMGERDQLGNLAFDGSKMDLQEVGCQSMGWIELAQNREMWRVFVNAVMNLRVS